jgi:hypothetical protein
LTCLCSWKTRTESVAILWWRASHQFPDRDVSRSQANNDSDEHLRSISRARVSVWYLIRTIYDSVRWGKVRSIHELREIGAIDFPFEDLLMQRRDRRFGCVNNQDLESLAEFVLHLHNYSSRYRYDFVSAKVESYDEQSYILWIWIWIDDVSRNWWYVSVGHSLIPCAAVEIIQF